MKFGNPVSSVTIGGTVSVSGDVGITGTPTVNASGSSNLGINSTPATTVFATNVAEYDNTNLTGTQTISLISAVSGTRFLLINGIISMHPTATSDQYQVKLVTSDGLTTIWTSPLLSGTGTGNNAPIIVSSLDFSSLILGNNVGVNLVCTSFSGSSSHLQISFSLFYSSATVSGGAFANPAVQVGSL